MEGWFEFYENISKDAMTSIENKVARIIDKFNGQNVNIWPPCIFGKL